MKRHPDSRFGDHARIDFHDRVAAELVKPEPSVRADFEPDSRSIAELRRRWFDQSGRIDRAPKRVPEFARNHLAFETHLRAVVDMLPVASAAAREIRARRATPVRA